MNSALYYIRCHLESAADARARADKMSNPETKQLMLLIAQSYERLAELTEDQFKIEAQSKILK
jgi:hypothetical protein